VTTAPKSDVLGGVRDAVSFLTPFGGASSAPRPETMEYFPLAGAAIGAVEGMTWVGLRRVMPALPAAALVVAIDAVCTGALHLDGLADSADGLFAHVPNVERLAIMADPAVGTFGTLALGFSIALRTAALASTPPSPVTLAALAMTARSVMVLGSRLLPYARVGGLATSFLPDPAPNESASSESPATPPPDRTTDGGLEGRPTQPRDRAVLAATFGIASALGIATASRGRRGGEAVVAGGAAAAVLFVVARRRLGGFTGDVLGAAGAICETVGQLVAAAP
jgi:adenosylcobinamide-GDP ribazoletransferase